MLTTGSPRLPLHNWAWALPVKAIKHRKANLKIKHLNWLTGKLLVLNKSIYTC
jgi:hypothetical protein